MLEALAGRRVPYDEKPVETGRDQASTVRAKRQRADGGVMFGEEEEEIPGLRIPNPDLPAPAPGGEAPPIRAECHADPLFRVAEEGRQGALLVLPVPDVDGPAAARREAPAVGTESHAIPCPAAVVGAARVRAGEHITAGRPVPDLHLPVRADRGQVSAVAVEGHAENGIGVRSFRASGSVSPSGCPRP